MTTNKATETSSKQVWALLHKTVPDAVESDWAMIASLLKSHRASSLRKIDACVCCRVAYFSPVNEDLANYRFADLTECPYEDCLDANGQRNQRFVVNADGKSVPRNFFYFCPVSVWL